MISTSCDKGMIFLCQDKCSSDKEHASKHNYLIIGVDNNRGSLGLIQAMSITSMRSKEISMEVPIKLCNDYISYIVPYNLHSFLNSDIDIYNYKGCIIDTPHISKNDFIQLLIDIYTVSLGLGDSEDVVRRYTDYCNKFWNEYRGKTEYRNLDTTKNDEQIIMNNNKVLDKPKKVYTVRNNYNSSYKPNNNSSKKHNNISKKSKKNNKGRYISKQEEKEIELEMRDVTRNIPKQNNTNSSKESKCYTIGITLPEMVKFNNSHRFLTKWSDQEILDFIYGYKTYGYHLIHEVLPKKWTRHSSMSVHFTNCKKEAKKRHLNIDFNIDPLKKPVNKWSNRELTEYIELVKDKDDIFQLSYTGFETMTECRDLLYNIRQEISKRKIQIS